MQQKIESNAVGDWIECSKDRIECNWILNRMLKGSNWMHKTSNWMQQKIESKLLIIIELFINLIKWLLSNWIFYLIEWLLSNRIEFIEWLLSNRMVVFESNWIYLSNRMFIEWNVESEFRIYGGIIPVQWNQSIRNTEDLLVRAARFLFLPSLPYALEMNQQAEQDVSKPYRYNVYTSVSISSTCIIGPDRGGSGSRD